MTSSLGSTSRTPPSSPTCRVVSVMAVEVRLPTLLRPHADGAASVTAEGATVGDVFSDLVERYPGLSGQLVDDRGGLHKFVNVYRNDDDIRYLEQLDTKLSEVPEDRKSTRLNSSHVKISYAVF